MDAVNRRAWLDRTQSSDVVFFNMAFDTAHKGSGSQQLHVSCIECATAPTSIDIDGGGFSVVEHTGGTLSVIGAEHLIEWKPPTGDTMIRAWWISRGLLGIAVGRCANAQRRLVLYIINVCSTAEPAEHDLGIVESADCTVIARDAYIVCVAAGELRSWTIGSHTEGSVQVTGAPPRAVPGRVLDIRWIGQDREGPPMGLAIGAQPQHSFWFSVSLGQCSTHVHDMSQSIPPVVPSWRWHAAVVVTNESRDGASLLPPTQPILCLPGPASTVFYSLHTAAAAAEGGPCALHKTRFLRGWVWLCGTSRVFVILSPCRQMAAVCRMPLGERLFTLRADGECIQDAWVVGASSVCAIAAGSMLYLVDFSHLFLK
ncbi:hypothetical protein EV175_000049 [Coemansia sp. RSA 1933]|nr:hypothetical protein EV175_000049 [Coemansia sp. RSA 1933]